MKKLLWAVALVASAQIQPGIPEDLVKRLTGQSGQPETPAALSTRMGISSCGLAHAARNENRALAKALADQGAAALPAIEAALQSIQDRGSASPYAQNARWLMYAYAKILGPKAFPRLNALVGIMRLQEWAKALDESQALSLGVTSFVTSWRQSLGRPPDYRIFRCDPAQPREALDRLILAWEQGDRPLLERSLGSHAKVDFDRLGRRSGLVTVAYRMNVLGRWSEPEETLEEEAGEGPIRGSYARFTIDTDFVRGAADKCAGAVVQFTKVGDEYFVDNADIDELLGAFSACSTDLSARQ